MSENPEQSEFDNGWCIYIVVCKDATLYTGITNDIEARIEAHNSGKGAKYTRARLPVDLRYCEAAKNRSEASKREYQIKAMSRKQKLALFDRGV